MAPEAHIQLGQCTLHILGTIPGYVPDAQRVQAAAPSATCIAVGVPPEDVEGMRAFLADPALREEFPELDDWTELFLKQLGRFGGTETPSPDLAAAITCAADTNTPVEALDLDDEQHTDAHTTRLKMRHIVGMNRSRNKLLKTTFDDVKDPYDLAAEWDAREYHSKPLRAIQTERAEHMASRLADLAPSHETVLAVVPATRFDDICAVLVSSHGGTKAS